MATTNSIGNMSSSLTIDPGASGDSFVQFDINSTGEFRLGVDDNDGDSFKISLGSALGTNDTFVMTAAGERTMPLQPAFMAYRSSTDTDVTGDNSFATVIADTEIYDQTSDYNTTTGRFTAPVTGRYFFNATLRYDQITTSHSVAFWRLTTSNRNILLFSWNFSAVGDTPIYAGTLIDSSSSFSDMDLGDTAGMDLRVSGSTKTIDIYGEATNLITGFSGALIC